MTEEERIHVCASDEWDERFFRGVLADRDGGLSRRRIHHLDLEVFVVVFVAAVAGCESIYRGNDGSGGDRDRRGDLFVRDDHLGHRLVLILVAAWTAWQGWNTPIS